MPKETPVRHEEQRPHGCNTQKPNSPCEYVEDADQPNEPKKRDINVVLESEMFQLLFGLPVSAPFRPCLFQFLAPWLDQKNRLLAPLRRDPKNGEAE